MTKIVEELNVKSEQFEKDLQELIKRTDDAIKKLEK